MNKLITAVRQFFAGKIPARELLELCDALEVDYEPTD
jgi:hypothetical protein